MLLAWPVLVVFLLLVTLTDSGTPHDAEAGLGVGGAAISCLTGAVAFFLSAVLYKSGIRRITRWIAVAAIVSAVCFVIYGLTAGMPT